MKIEAFLDEFEELYARVTSGNHLDESYAELMIKMEKTFEIPVVITEEWEQENKPISTLYRVIASNRLMQS
ncbi:hypothetical protein [Jeotgalibacillus soli]|uniref:Uncharacterized protein n=1 Tax=Jeotgalibacillus soli TaxID=889306 RepID=A0A0C2S6F0_9BACL|nr:hypothetical protein [Jeotgalibacillus soli]KIL49599.1 hypothetical protein KP78_10670 [Jeotgalibacillus soli]